jgi:hypothetical protein
MPQTAIAKLDIWVRKAWPYLLAGAVAVLGVSYALFRLAVAGPAHDNTAKPLAVQPSTTSTGAAQETGRDLDGVIVAPAATSLQPYAVMVETMIDARPMSGIAQANLVVEAPVEGGIMRLMAVYDASTTVDKIGPVRSARPYYVEWAKSLNAVYAHVGGSPEALNRISGLADFRNLDEMANGQFFWRSKDRSAPHNAYTSTDLLHQAATDKKWQPEKFLSWTYDSVPTIEAGDVTEISIPYGGAGNVKWKYDKAEDKYWRTMGTKPHTDSDGTQVSAKNILVVLTEQRVLDDYGRLSIRTAGLGKAIFYRNGYAQEAQWIRDAGTFIRLQTPDGRPVSFARGTTWVEIVTDAAKMPSIKPTL